MGIREWVSAPPPESCLTRHCVTVFHGEVQVAFEDKIVWERSAGKRFGLEG